MPLFVWAIGGLLGYRMVSRGNEALGAAVPWIVGGVALYAVVKLKGK